jgi:hypothetical protein
MLVSEKNHCYKRKSSTMPLPKSAPTFPIVHRGNGGRARQRAAAAERSVGTGGPRPACRHRASPRHSRCSELIRRCRARYRCERLPGLLKDSTSSRNGKDLANCAGRSLSLPWVREILFFMLNKRGRPISAGIYPSCGRSVNRRLALWICRGATWPPNKGRRAKLASRRHRV